MLPEGSTVLMKDIIGLTPLDAARFVLLTLAASRGVTDLYPS